MSKVLKVVAVAFFALSMTACWEKKEEQAPAVEQNQEMEQMDSGEQMQDQQVEEQQEEIPEN